MKMRGEIAYDDIQLAFGTLCDVSSWPNGDGSFSSGGMLHFNGVDRRVHFMGQGSTALDAIEALRLSALEMMGW